MSDLLRLLGIRHPIIQAPMGGGPGTPALAAAVTNAGGLGSLAGAYLTPAELEEEIAHTRALTSGSLNVNLFAGGYHEHPDRDPAPILALLRDVHRALEIGEPALPHVPPDPFHAQLEVVLRAKPRVFSFTFGIPSAEAMRALRDAGIVIVGTATTVEEARMLADAGVDAIVAQGAEAGAHRGTFARSFAASMVPALDLVAQIVSSTHTPVIASGGIMNGEEIASALKAGASAVQLGTAFLACDEAGTSHAYRHALARATGEDTVITRAYSGRAARGIRNTFIDLVGEREELILPFPIQNSLTRTMRAASAKRDNPDYLSLWAGTGVARMRPMPAGDLIALLVHETESAS